MTASRQIHSVQSLVVGWGQRCGLKAEVIVDLFYFRDWSLITQIGVGGGGGLQHGMVGWQVLLHEKGGDGQSFGHADKGH